jgi:Putative peptidoglycan binding domain
MAAEKHVKSSGLFGLPSLAKSVDWVVVNDSPEQATVTVTVYKGPIGVTKVELPPGPVQAQLAPGEVFHNANSVGPGLVFEPGFPFEVVVESTDDRVLPAVEVWSDHGATVIAGTRIGPDGFTRLSQTDPLDPLPTVQKGDKGAAVGKVQGLLRATNPALTEKTMPIDRDFGPVTFNAVKVYQAQHGFTADGVVRRETWRSLLES